MKRLAIVAVLAACSPPDRGPQFRPAGNASPRRGGDLRFAIYGGVGTLDPAYGNEEASAIPQHALFDTLVDYAPDGFALEPHLADALPAISADGLTYTFHLRDGIAFSDGTPVVADDFVYAIERVRRSQDSPYQSFVANVAEVTARDPRTVVFRLAEPNAAFIQVLTMTFATPQHRTHAGDRLRRTPLGTGPYQLASWDEGQRLVLARNPHARDPERGLLDTITMLENVPADTQFLMFERGELDTLAHPSAPDYLWLVSEPAWKPYLHTRAMLTAFGSRMVVTQKPFDDVRVRRALNYALDKQHSVRLLHGTAIAAHGILPPGVLGRDPSIAPYPHDPVKARALLAAAGYPDGFAVDYVIPADDEAETLAASMQGDLAEVGVRMRIVRVAFEVYADAIGRPASTPFSKATWIGDYPDPTSFLDAKFHSRGIATENASDDTNYANPELDALLDRARVERDAGIRDQLYRRAEQILYDDAPWIWDYHQLDLEVAQPYVRGAIPHPIWGRDYTRAWLDVGPDGRPVGR